MSKKSHRLLVTLLIISVFLLLAFPATVFADGGAAGSEKEVNGYRVRLTFAEPVKPGENHFHIQIADAMNMPVADAEVEVSAMPVEGMDEMAMATEAPAAGVMTSDNNMDGMGMATEEPAAGIMQPDQPAADGHGEESLTVMLEPTKESGEYAGELHFETSGEWMFNVHFTVNGKTSAVGFPVKIARSLALNYAILAGFFSFNVAVVAYAAALKKRKSIT